MDWCQNRQQICGIISFSLGDGKRMMMPAHRAHYMAENDVVLDRNQYVCHKCDNPACVRLDHLFLGSPKDNSRDCTEERGQ